MSSESYRTVTDTGVVMLIVNACDSVPGKHVVATPAGSLTFPREEDALVFANRVVAAISVERGTRLSAPF